MNWRISLIVIAFLAFGCKKTEQKKEEAVKYNYLLEAQEFKNSVNSPRVKIIDFRKKNMYEKEHIAGALHLWRTDIENKSYPYSGMMPSVKQIENVFGNLGISSNDTIVIYDNNGLCEAARLWWILQNYNFKNIKMLQGGIDSWKSAGGKVTTELPKIQKSVFKFSGKPKMQYSISKEDVLRVLDKNIRIIDTRTLDEFSGFKLKKGASKAGRIPKSIHVDWAEAVNYNGDKHLKSIPILANIYTNKLSENKNDSIILYCHSGVRSAHTTFVLTQLLGYKNVKNYDGSWTEWSYFNDLPYVNDSKTTN